MSEEKIGDQPQGQLEQEFWLFHNDNPNVYQLLCKSAQEVIDKNYSQFAIACLWEHMRWELTVVTGDVNFVLPNNHRAYYARLWLRDHPEFPKFFKTTMLRSVRDEPVDRFGRGVADYDEDCS